MISGYLITSIIAGEIKEGRFSFAKFYERRIRRIFPALAAVLFCSTIAAWYILLPAEFEAFGKTVLSTSLFASNIHFWRQSGYFDPASDTKPLLHTWSLSVEEQFYILFPIVLILAARWLATSRRVTALVAFMALLSFLLSVIWVERAPSSAFYLAPSRAWELLAGALVALGAFPHIRRSGVANWLGTAGLLLIAFSLFAVSARDPFPGLNAVPAVLGTTLVIYAGTYGPNVASRMLSLPVLTFVGLISYSLYLWHWPLIVFAKQVNIEPLAADQRVAILAASLVLAYLSWRFIEQPFRVGGLQLGQRTIFAGGGAVIAVCTGFGILAALTNGLPARIPSHAQQLAAAAVSFPPRQEECLASERGWISPKQACSAGADVPARFAVWGDSHALTLMPAFEDQAARHGEAVKFYAYAGCPSVLGVKRIGLPEHKCLEYNTEALAQIIADSNIKTVILHARHAVYLRGWSLEIGPAEQLSDEARISDRTGAPLTADDRHSAYEQGLADAVTALAKAGKSIVIIYPVPETGYNVPLVLARLAMNGSQPDVFTRPFANYTLRNAAVTAMLDRLQPAAPVLRLYPHERLCSATNCLTYAEGEPLYYDSHHLSRAGVAYIADLLEPIFAPRPATETSTITPIDSAAGRGARL